MSTIVTKDGEIWPCQLCVTDLRLFEVGFRDEKRKADFVEWTEMSRDYSSFGRRFFELRSVFKFLLITFSVNFWRENKKETIKLFFCKLPVRQGNQVNSFLKIYISK